jgi:hypothetical protein
VFRPAAQVEISGFRVQRDLFFQEEPRFPPKLFLFWLLAVS